MTTRTRWFAWRLAAAWITAVVTGLIAADTLLAVSMRRAIQSPVDGVRQFPAVVTALDIQPRGRLVAAAGDDHVIRIWNMDDGTLVHRLVGHTDWVRAVAFSPDGTTLVSSGNDRRVLLWDVATGRLKAAAGRAQSCRSARWLSATAAGGWRRPGLRTNCAFSI